MNKAVETYRNQVIGDLRVNNRPDLAIILESLCDRFDDVSESLRLAMKDLRTDLERSEQMLANGYAITSPPVRGMGGRIDALHAQREMLSDEARVLVHAIGRALPGVYELETLSATRLLVAPAVSEVVA